jgi:hypothetical protein
MSTSLYRPVDSADVPSIFDLIGCEYNMPADYATLQSEGLFISCEGDLQDEVGTYTSNGQSECENESERSERASQYFGSEPFGVAWRGAAR